MTFVTSGAISLALPHPILLTDYCETFSVRANVRGSGLWHGVRAMRSSRDCGQSWCIPMSSSIAR